MKELREVAKRVAMRYALRVWWADREEMEQEAWVAILEAARTWKPDGGASLRYYVERAAVLRVRRFLWKMSAPVSGPVRNPEKLRGLHRAPLEAAPESPDDGIEEQMWWNQLTERMKEVIESGSHAVIVAKVLLEGVRPRHLAAETGVPVHRIWRYTSDARKRLKHDDELRDAFTRYNEC